MCTKSSFCGVIDEIPYIRVDNFENASQQHVRAYFLSHCHTDHTNGLFSDNFLLTLEKTKAKIYMSEQTAMVINYESKPRNRLEEFIVPLKLGSQLITIPRKPEENLNEILLNVTLIAAGHSYGSIMFLFETNLKTILFTGDFRVNSNDLKSYKHLHDKKGDPIKIDAMYVDTTFIDERYFIFPKRSTSVESMTAEIKQWLNEDENNAVALHTSAKYGYEFVFNAVYEELGIKVCIPEDRWGFYKTQKSVPGVTDEPTKIHVCKNKNARYNHTACPGYCIDYTHLYVHLSAMIWDNYDVDDKITQRIHKRLNVCFPTHCSRSELRYFVEYFTPNKVVGFPKPYEMSPIKKNVVTRKRKIDSPMKSDDKVDVNVIKQIMFDI